MVFFLSLILFLFGLAWVITDLTIALILLSLFWTGFFIYHYRQFKQIYLWVRLTDGTTTPPAYGIWVDFSNALSARFKEYGQQHSELSALLERFQMAAEAIPDGTIIIDGNGVIEWMNSPAARLLRLRKIHDIGNTLTYFVRDQVFYQYLEQPHPSKPLLFEPSRHSGLTLRVHSSPFSAGRRLLLIRDETEIKRLEIIRHDFVANISHELRTPLTVVHGFLESLIDNLSTLSQGEIQHQLSTCLGQTYRMHNLMRDLLTLAELESDLPVRDDVVEIDQLLGELSEDVKTTLGSRQSLRYQCVSGYALRGNCQELRTALANLIHNAIRYSGENGIVEIDWSVVENGGCLSVQDNGIGIAHEHIPRLTERFYRVDNSRSRLSGGTGLGLAIVKHVVERHQAKLVIESEPDKGSCFSILMPLERLIYDARASF